MPRFANEDDKRTARAIEAWKQAASHEVDDIGGWRDATYERSFHSGDSARGWGEPPNGFYSDTLCLVGWITIRYPKLDPTPLQDVYGAVTAWYEDRNASRIPPQPVLFATLERAMMILQAAEMDLYTRLVYEDGRRNPLSDSPPDVKGTPNESEQAVIDYLCEKGVIGLEAVLALPRNERTTGEKLAHPSIGRGCDGQFKATLAHMVGLGWLGNAWHSRRIGGYYLTTTGARLANRGSGLSQD